MTPLQPPPVFSPVQDKSAVILPIWQAFFVDLAQAVNALAVLTAVVPIANGGTNATSFVTSGIVYFNGTRLVNTANAVMDGSGNIQTSGQLEVKPSSTSDFLVAPLTGATSYIAVGLAGSVAAGAYNFASKIGDENLYINRPTGKDILFGENASANQLVLKTGGRSIFGGQVAFKGYTVATLPAGAIGDRAHVTDALAPVFGAAVAGGGAVMVPVYFTGAAWFVG